MWKNFVERGRPQMTIRRMRIECWINIATNTHTQNMWYLLLFNRNSVCTNAPQCHVIRTRAVREVSVHFEHLKNRSRGLDATWQPVRGELTTHP
jgi:hypothetical protein